MPDLLEKLIGLFPAYFNDLLALVSGPKRFFARRLSTESDMKDALLFLAISFLISWILIAPFNRGGSFLVELGTDAAFVLSYIVAYGGALCLAWRIAGARTEIQKFLPIHFYYSGVLKLILSIAFLGAMGALRATEPASYKEMLNAVFAGDGAGFYMRNSERLLGSLGYRLSLWIIVIGCGAAASWLFVGWGAYRELIQTSRLRSTVAGVLFVVVCVPVTGLLWFVANALP
jgi:hypothetical protein